MQYETKQGIEDYEEQEEDSSDSENEDGTDVTSASYDEFWSNDSLYVILLYFGHPYGKGNTVASSEHY